MARLVKRVVIGFGVLFLLGALILIFKFPWVFNKEAVPGTQGPNVLLTSAMFDLERPAATAYNQLCAYCHDAGIGPDLGANEYDALTIQSFVRNGYGAMPAMTETQVSDEDIEQISKYLASYR